MKRNTLLLALLGTGSLLGLAIAGQHFMMADDWSGESRSISQRQGLESRVEKGGNELTQENTQVPESLRRLTVVTAGSLQRLEQGEWTDLAEGEVLSVDDRIRTVGEGTTRVSAGDGSEIELIDEVEISVETLTRSLAEFELHRGRLRANLDERSGLSLRVRSSGASAEAQSGAFVVYADGVGMVAVASETAEVRLQARNREVVVNAGQQAIVQPESPPGDPEAIPEEVFLRVVWPERRLQRESQFLVRGEVRPGTAVRVEGEPTPVKSDGTFEAMVELDAGPNRVIVQATDPIGHRRRDESPQIMVKNRPPPIEVLSQGRWNE